MNNSFEIEGNQKIKQDEIMHICCFFVALQIMHMCLLGYPYGEEWYKVTEQCRFQHETDKTEQLNHSGSFWLPWRTLLFSRRPFELKSSEKKNTYYILVISLPVYNFYAKNRRHHAWKCGRAE